MTTPRPRSRPLTAYDRRCMREALAEYLAGAAYVPERYFWIVTFFFGGCAGALMCALLTDEAVKRKLGAGK